MMNGPSLPTAGPDGNTPLPDGRPYKLRWSLETFGERFRLVLNDGQHETSMLLSPTELRKVRDRATAVLGEGRDARRRLRQHRHETP